MLKKRGGASIEKDGGRMLRIGADRAEHRGRRLADATLWAEHAGAKKVGGDSGLGITTDGLRLRPA